MPLALFRNLLIVAVTATIPIQYAAAQQHPNSAIAKATENRGGSGGSDENIKKDRQPNDPNFQMDAPPDKGGPKTRGSGVCRIHIDNRTRWRVDVYTDGDYRGEVDPFGDSTGYVGCGDTTFYGKATFTDGSAKIWGPSAYYVDGYFTWSITY